MEHEDNHIDTPRAREFVAALRSFEQDGNPSGLVAQFADGATVWRLDGRAERTDVEAFWREYRDQFERVSTTFRNAVENDREVALEWDSDIVPAGGHPTTYRGVTVLEIDPSADAVTALRVYYDTVAVTGGTFVRS
ncbi:nuclear transport factor 2 family protein [Pseudonocardia endophytica]|uniref:SnoaL-like protein n=1 Tax=Pseudonocardia endophytica TaxID=401976 RepID=A0A4R1HJL0_PSEEN|nr:nuclear transport factor 2 family protein [Pseudonocardia endophytica]TCK21083.1 SnoaL-like protein [Pseudonocardia endophytica]